jgi:hypothetical protein
MGIIFVGLIFIVSYCSDSSDTTVTIKPDVSRYHLRVEIEGQHKSEYKIVLRKDGAVHGEKENSPATTFSDLDGTYLVEVQFIGKGKTPEINNYPRTFAFIRPTNVVERPQITDIAQNPLRLTKKINDYTLTVKTDTQIVPLNETEFSRDGSKWQRSNIFHNMPAGTYTFYARHAQVNDLSDAKQITLTPFIPTPIPTAAELTSLLQNIASGNQHAIDQLKKMLGNRMKVYGASNINNIQELANEAFINEAVFQVVQIDTDQEEEITSITVK